jgi:uncharacterized protein YdeI (YjbR/CyaY-like superfamily)
MKPTFFATPADFRRWLEAHHADREELLVGFHKRDSGKPSITWPESVDQALCFGWIDGVRKRIDETSYTIRFTPRKLRSHWSRINVARVGALSAAGLMRPAGLTAFAARSEERTALASHERKEPAVLPPAYARQVRANAKAWAYFEAQAPWYRRAAVHWVITAKKEETRARRLAALIAACAAGRTVGPLTRPSKTG